MLKYMYMHFDFPLLVGEYRYNLLDLAQMNTCTANRRSEASSTVFYLS